MKRGRSKSRRRTKVLWSVICALDGAACRKSNETHGGQWGGHLTRTTLASFY